MTVLAIGDSNLEPSRTDSLQGRPPRFANNNTVPIFAQELGHDFRCWAKGGASNHWMLEHVNYILDNIDQFNNPIVMVGWSQWEREEWEWPGDSLSVSVSPYYDIPEEMQERYQQWRSGITPEVIGTKRLFWHDMIYQVHLKLRSLNIPHVFWSTYDNFVGLDNHYDWHGCFFKPYDIDGCMKAWFKANKIDAKPTDPWHYASDAHLAWGKTLANFFKEHQ